MCSSPKLIAAYHVLHRLSDPRHPPYALICFKKIKIIRCYSDCLLLVLQLFIFQYVKELYQWHDLQTSKCDNEMQMWKDLNLSTAFTDTSKKKNLIFKSSNSKIFKFHGGGYQRRSDDPPEQSRDASDNRAIQPYFLWRISESNRWPSACKADALANWANPPRLFCRPEQIWTADPYIISVVL